MKTSFVIEIFVLWGFGFFIRCFINIRRLFNTIHIEEYL